MKTMIIERQDTAAICTEQGYVHTSVRTSAEPGTLPSNDSLPNRI